MATSLYDLSVATFLQTVGAVAGFLEKAAGHCAATCTDPDDLVNARLYPDMAPRSGTAFSPRPRRPARTEAALRGFIPDEVDGWAGKALGLQIGPRRLAFTAETYILSFAL
eukprot:gene46046-62367_t